MTNPKTSRPSSPADAPQSTQPIEHSSDRETLTLMSTFLNQISKNELPDPVFTIIGGLRDKRLYDWVSSQLEETGHCISEYSMFNPTQSTADFDESYAAISIESGGRIFFSSQS